MTNPYDLFERNKLRNFYYSCLLEGIELDYPFDDEWDSLTYYGDNDESG